MKIPLTNFTLAISLGVGTIAAFIVITFCTKNKKKYGSKTPGINWKQIGVLKEIDLYPIKSSSAVAVEAAACDYFGLSTKGIQDRRLIVINDADDKIASVGRYPRMLAIKVKINADGILSLSTSNEATIKINADGILSLSTSNEATIKIDLNDLKAQNRPQTVKKMKGYSLNLSECLTKHHEWISRVILQKSSGMRLFFLTDNPKIEKSFWRTMKNDLIPVMVMHDKSVEELNSQFTPSSVVHHLQFRGNLLIKSLVHVPAFDEDRWLWLKIGDDAENFTIFSFDSACLRCLIPNINIKTCKRSTDFEPLKTMRTFRLRSHPKEPEMGIYFKVYKTGRVQCGDPVYVQYK